MPKKKPSNTADNTSTEKGSKKQPEWKSVRVRFWFWAILKKEATNWFGENLGDVVLELVYSDVEKRTTWKSKYEEAMKEIAALNEKTKSTKTTTTKTKKAKEAKTS